MKLSLLHLACFFCIGFSPAAHAVVVAVSPSQFASFSLDMDGDGVAEISRFQSTAGAISSDFFVDGADAGAFVNFPTTTFAGFESQVFADLESLITSDLFAGTYVAPAVITRGFDNFIGYGFNTPSTPIQAWWSYGTSGSGNAPFHLLGVVIDYRAYFTSGGIADIDIYYNDYGSFSPNQSSGPISLAATGIPEPSTAILLMSAVLVGLVRRRNSAK